ncbi:MAG: 4a-hydroxytetrahydrobiopterin dehydratase [Phycisphaerae bacterium]|nr:4a-hydroxytetrahydrobiopterin dehydratase [Phycisphaerae bacterium]
MNDPTTCSLANKTCIPCKGGVPALRGEALEELASKTPDWDVVGEHYLHRVWTWKNFAEALAFVNRVGALAEEQGHHPTIELSWGRVVVDIHTHKIDGLTESDFILAAKIDALQAG